MKREKMLTLEPLNLEMLAPQDVCNISYAEGSTKDDKEDTDTFTQNKGNIGNTVLSPRKRQLLSACAKGTVQTVKKLLQVHKVSPNFCNYDKRTPLHLAAAEGHLEIVKVLIEAGASLTWRDRWGCTPLLDAMGGKHKEVVQYIFDSLQNQCVTKRRHSLACMKPWTPKRFSFTDDTSYCTAASKLSPRSPSSNKPSNDSEVCYLYNDDMQTKIPNSHGQLGESQDPVRVYCLQQINDEYRRRKETLLRLFEMEKQILFERKQPSTLLRHRN
eukprot:jgi/Galph1/2689/GphlegSOOS_G1353.1